MNQDEEKWKDIQGYDGLYMVSDKGRVMNVETGRVLKPVITPNGYEQVTLYKDGKFKQYYNHRLTAEVFVPNPNNLAQVNHIDECKTNNDIRNLEWVTVSQNVKHSIHKQLCKIRQHSLDGEFIREWKSFREIERELGFRSSNINMCCQGKLKKAYGYKWSYADGLHQRRINRPVIVLSKEDDFIAQFKSAAEASRCLGISKKSIWPVLKGIYKTTHGFKFRYLDEL